MRCRDPAGSMGSRTLVLASPRIHRPLTHLFPILDYLSPGPRPVQVSVSSSRLVHRTPYARASPASSMPQLAQGTFAQRHQTTAPQRLERGSREEPEDAMPRSHSPRPVRWSESEHERDSGSELERRVSPGLGKLAVANAQIVPNSSEESAQEKRGRPP